MKRVHMITVALLLGVAAVPVDGARSWSLFSEDGAAEGQAATGTTPSTN